MWLWMWATWSHAAQSSQPYIYCLIHPFLTFINLQAGFHVIATNLWFKALAGFHYLSGLDTQVLTPKTFPKTWQSPVRAHEADTAFQMMIKTYWKLLHSFGRRSRLCVMIPNVLGDDLFFEVHRFPMLNVLSIRIFSVPVSSDLSNTVEIVFLQFRLLRAVAV